LLDAVVTDQLAGAPLGRLIEAGDPFVWRTRSVLSVRAIVSVAQSLAIISSVLAEN
jgi:hypothetical protein